MSGRGDVPDTDAIASAFGEIGVTPDDDVLVYGASVGSRVTRVAFALAAVGHEGSIRVLNGGLSAWNGRLGTGSRDRVSPTEYEPDPGVVDVGHSRVARRPDRDVQRGRSGARRRARAGGVPRRRGF